MIWVPPTKWNELKTGTICWLSTEWKLCTYTGQHSQGGASICYYGSQERYPTPGINEQPLGEGRTLKTNSLFLIFPEKRLLQGDLLLLSHRNQMWHLNPLVILCNLLITKLHNTIHQFLINMLTLGQWYWFKTNTPIILL